MSTSIYVRPDTWDVAVDSAGNIASCTAPYELAQSAANAARTFIAECFYDTTLGVPYWSEVLGHDPSPELFRGLIVAAVLKVPGVASATVVITNIVNGTVTGQIQLIDTSGVTSVANF